MRRPVQRVGLVLQFSGLPSPSPELGHVVQEKAWDTWLLKWGGLREAGCTVQRTASALGSGRITGRCCTSPRNA
ncbi:hypothetical protein CQW23_34894 [Capsicum baccatum]|uniref:Uncharacterized protein n=1 Tax=Capsicum baccatum TaxID=33114 RepID=A0A2G2UXL5_CAPBA|nr:hypothetical protein CQW23_34894 [Capsicum baccatum]